jgi:hypothetical protein
MPIPAKAMPVDAVRAYCQTSERSVYFVHRTQEVPSDLDLFGESGRYPYTNTQVSVEITSGTSGDMTVTWYVTKPGSVSAVRTYSSDISTPTWQSEVTDSDHCDDMTFAAQQMVGETRSHAVRLKHVADSTATAYVFSAVFESVFGDNVSSSQTSTRKIEQADRTGVERLYLPDRSCSAWHVKNALCETYNKFTEEAKTYVSYPVIDYVGV